jgi:hypothetical protein
MIDTPEPFAENALTAWTAVTLDQDSWVVNSRASWHMTGDCKLFLSRFTLLKEPRTVEIADGTSLRGIKEGKIRLSLGKGEITVSDMLYVPGLVTNLLLVSQLEDCNITISTGGGMLKIHS